MTKFKTLGICQCCGREQAVVTSGHMSKHGYTVGHGWLIGVCSGDRHLPMEKDRSVADVTVSMVHQQVKGLRLQADLYESGKAHPAEANKISWLHGEEKTLPWAEATGYQREKTIQREVWNLRQRAKSGEDFANALSALADKYHGQPFRTQAKPAPTTPILVGEKRRNRLGMVEAVGVTGTRVFWKHEATKRSGWAGTRAWRLLPTE